MLYFATLFDENFLARGLALYGSLLKHSKNNFFLFVLALDNRVPEKLETFISSSNVKVIKLEDIELYYPELKLVKGSRSKIEYYFTLSPFLPSYILANFPNVNRITSLDADILFFSDPNIIFDHYVDADILITPHSFPNELKYLEDFGKYNVSFQSFKRTDNAVRCLDKWKSDCINFCSDYFDSVNNRFADQKYLDSWENDFDKVVPIDLSSSGLAPWNIAKYKIELFDNKIFVDGKPLIFYHFHHLRFLNRFQIVHGLEKYNAFHSVSNKAVKFIYKTYIQVLANSTFSNSINVLRYNFSNTKPFWKKLLQSGPYWLYLKPFLIHVQIRK